MKELLKNIFDKIDLSTILLTVYMTSIFFTFSSNNLLRTMMLLKFKVDYQFIISMIAVVLSFYYISLLFEFFRKKIQSIIFWRNRGKFLRTLTMQEKQYIMAFYDRDNKRLNTSCQFDCSDAIVNLLSAKTIISQGSAISVGMLTFDYFLQPWAYDYISKLINNKKIVVENDTFSWND